MIFDDEPMDQCPSSPFDSFRFCESPLSYLLSYAQLGEALYRGVKSLKRRQGILESWVHIQDVDQELLSDSTDAKTWILTWILNQTKPTNSGCQWMSNIAQMTIGDLEHVQR